METFSDQAPLFIFLFLLLVMLAAAIAAFRLSKRGANPEKRTTGNLIAALVAALVAGIITLGFEFPMLGDFRSPEVPLRDAITGATGAGAICIPAWIVAIRCLILAIGESDGQKRSSPDPSDPLDSSNK